MRVLFIAHEATRTGASIALLQEINFICKYHTEIVPEVYFLRGGELLNEYRDLCPIYEGWIANPRLERVLHIMRLTEWYLSRQLMKRKYDCIYANSIVSFGKAVQLKIRLGSVRLIGHVHEADCMMKQYFNFETPLDSFDTFITVSQLAANNLIENYAVPSYKILIQHPISSWVDLLLRGKVSLTVHDYNEAAKLIGCFCKEEWAKATDVIPLFLHRFFEKYPEQNCKLVIIGKMSERYSYLLDFVLRKMKLKNRVIMLGGVNNPLDYIAQLDILLLMSREESFGLVAQEAAMLEKPIVGFYDATGAAEWIEKGAGILVPYMDLGQMSDAVNMLLSDETKRSELGRQAKNIVKEMYENDCKMESVISVLLNKTSNE
jgi:glycosyltransferase involved in cell wall biosynthesis